MSIIQTNFFRPGYTPPTAFYYSVKFDGKRNMDSSFQEISGLKLTMDLEERKEGGDNSSVYRLPTQPKYENLVLKRCLVLNSELTKWCKKAFEDFDFDPLDVQIALLGANGGTLASWNIVRAIPVSWELTPLKSTTNELAIETLTLNYKFFKRER